MNDNDQTKLYNDIIDLLKHMNDYLKHFPKEEKYGLVLEIKKTGLDMVKLYVKCYKQYHNKTSKQELDITHETFRVMTRLAYEMHYFEFKDGVRDMTEPKVLSSHRYAVLSKKIDSIGKRIGGWLKINPQ